MTCLPSRRAGARSISWRCSRSRWPMRCGLRTGRASRRRRAFRWRTMGRAMSNDNKPVDEISGTEMTGHDWDGIQELNTPLPRWWLGIFYATIVWAIGYWVVMPAWPLVNGYTHGLIDHSQRDDVTAKVRALQD